MADMSIDIFKDTSYGIIALERLKPVSENFRLYEVETCDNAVKITGADFRIAKKGPNKGKLSILLSDTKRTVYVTREEILEQQNKPTNGENHGKI